MVIIVKKVVIYVRVRLLFCTTGFNVEHKVGVCV